MAPRARGGELVAVGAPVEPEREGEMRRNDASFVGLEPLLLLLLLPVSSCGHEASSSVAVAAEPASSEDETARAVLAADPASEEGRAELAEFATDRSLGSVRLLALRRLEAGGPSEQLLATASSILAEPAPADSQARQLELNAAGALGRLGTPEARSVLDRHVTAMTDEAQRRAILAVIATSSPQGGKP